MTLIGTALATAVMAAIPSSAVLAPAPGLSSHDAPPARVLLAGSGYIRRDLGLDPVYERRHNQGGDREYHRSRGFDSPVETPPSAGIVIYEDPATGDMFILPHGLNFHVGDPALLEPGR
jgi:hypothetical protein